MRRLLILPLVVLAISGCQRPFTLFRLQIDDRSGSREVGLTERPGRPPGEEGLLARAGEPLVLIPSSSVSIDSAAHLLVRLSAPARDLTVTIRDDDGEVVAQQRPFALFPPAADEVGAADEAEGAAGGAGDDGGVDAPGVVAAVPLAGPANLARVELSLGADRDEPLAVGGLAIGDAPVGVGLFGSAASFYASPGVLVRRWHAPGGSARWEVARGDAAAWAADRPVEIRYRLEPSRPYEQPESASLVVGDAAYRVALRPGVNRVVFHPAVEGVMVDSLSLESSASGLVVEWIGPLQDEIDELPAAIPVDMGTLMRYEPERWRRAGFELFSWTLYPEVLILDSATYEVQARFFKRLAFYVEKVGYRGTLLNDEQLRGRHGYNAHNYNAEGLAAFFNAVQEEALALTEEETLLREILLAHGIVVRGEQGYEPGRGGILAVSQESRGIPTLRELLVAHEAYHGVYYAEPDYVHAVDELWDALDEEQQRYWRLLLSGLRYDVDDDYLLRNEYHAYLMQQPVAHARWYFESRSAERIARWFPGSADWLASYLARYSGTHREQAEAVERALRTITGLGARDVACLEPAGVR